MDVTNENGQSIDNYTVLPENLRRDDEVSEPLNSVNKGHLYYGTCMNRFRDPDNNVGK